MIESSVRARSSGDRAPDSGSGCRGFKSLRARFSAQVEFDYGIWAVQNLSKSSHHHLKSTSRQIYGFCPFLA